MVEGLKDSRDQAEIQAECSHIVYWIGNMCTWQEKIPNLQMDRWYHLMNIHASFLSL